MQNGDCYRTLIPFKRNVQEDVAAGCAAIVIHDSNGENSAKLRKTTAAFGLA
jgi:hypothetical protein